MQPQKGIPHGADADRRSLSNWFAITIERALADGHDRLIIAQDSSLARALEEASESGDQSAP